MSATQDLLTNYQHVISELNIVTGSKGVFDVTVDDALIYSKGATGRHARPGEVLELFTEVVGADVPRYS